MRIVIIGQAAFGEKVLEKLVQMGEEVSAVYTIPDAPGRQNPLKDLAVKLGIPVLQPPGLRAPEVFTGYVKFKPELNIMAFVTNIVPESVLNYPKYGTIQYHPSLLPRHRGGSSINWAVIKGEKKTGLTIFWPDKGLDTGPILLQKEVDISPDDTVGSLYFNKLFSPGIEGVAEAVSLIKAGKAPKIPQDEREATYEGLCTEKEAVINWAKSAEEVYNLIRGTNPQPGAVTDYQGKQVKLFDSQLVRERVKAAPGEVVSVSKEGFTVAARDGGVLVKRAQLKGAPKTLASELAGELNLKAGDKLGS